MKTATLCAAALLAFAFALSTHPTGAGEPAYLLSSEIEQRFPADTQTPSVTQPVCSTCRATPVEQLIDRGYTNGRQRLSDIRILPARGNRTGHLGSAPQFIKLWPVETVGLLPKTEVEQMIDAGFSSGNMRWPPEALDPEVYSNSFTFGGIRFSR
jgi:hypothetical protein